jgi:hypothetical protein
MVVLDANILIRAILGRRVQQLIDTHAGRGVRFFSPDVAFDDAEKYLPLLLKKRGKPDVDVSASQGYMRNRTFLGEFATSATGAVPMLTLDVSRVT